MILFGASPSSSFTHLKVEAQDLAQADAAECAA